ncbi:MULTISPECIES: hypothetical protein [Mycobacterium]|uniref:Uncharacterized protein n=2 Tax=Mycobacterium ulcerans group TaxID=2993898 RepID=A0A9N7LUY2_9MYCO|nr:MULTISPECIES: hypothetical protein [Mycobacterium]EPQ47847.1 hypothetical protein MMSP_3608 [Mycobacterium sp. 012931]MBC9865056.1 hypothetical protein [Mycobacterium pseudoshottsii]RFZ61289.1 hypothetical protein BB170200_02182 [Mycobacterium marinum]RFZ66866.1 hypothetical protein DL240490_01875 [Mycobacterium marinum]BAV41264.1 predicted transposase, IS256 family [Mycobacterium ulcerans subsp. shinshuense]
MLSAISDSGDRDDRLIGATRSRWRAVNAPHLVALVRAGAKFGNGELVERPDEIA